MRKTLVIVLALAALAIAGENWLGYTSPTFSALPANAAQGTPMLMPPAGGYDMPGLDTLKYDDNTQANAWAWNTAGNGWGTKFIRPANPVTLAGAMIGLWASSWPTPGSNDFQVNVYQADGPDGAPGTLLFNSGVLTGTRGAWNYVPVNVPIVDFDFYIFYVQPDTYPTCPGMALDAKVNAPNGRYWVMQDSLFSPGDKGGDWMIRAIVDYTQQTNNVGPMYFGALSVDTVPNINVSVQATFKNFGTATQNPGVPVRMEITGPQGYVHDWTTDTTTGTWAARGLKSVTFRPPWHIPDTSGEYDIKVWSDLPTDEYRANDTMTWAVTAARWLTYANWNVPYWITWANPMRATLFDPADFGLSYPVLVSAIRSEFYWSSQSPWDDSLFQFAIYDDAGDSLWMSDTLRAKVYPVAMSKTIFPPVSLSSGSFYATVIPHSSSGHPDQLGDSVPQGKSWYGSPNGGWVPWTMGELFTSVSARTNLTALAERGTVPAKPAVSVLAAPNPSRSPVICWQIPARAPVQITLYDATGREVRALTTNDRTASLTGSVRMRTDDLEPGVYLVRMISGVYQAKTKLVVAR